MPIFAMGPARATPGAVESKNMNTIRKITSIASMALALTAGAAFANTNTPTVQSQGHWKSQTSAPAAAQHSLRRLGGVEPAKDQRIIIMRQGVSDSRSCRSDLTPP
jgi:hypothetical protein